VGRYRSQSARDGGQTLVAKATGMSRNSVHVGVRELEHTANALMGDHKRVRRPGGGRKRLIEHAPLLVAHLDALVEPTSRGDPQSPLRWTCKSTRQLATALQQQGHKVGRQKVAELLADLGYSLQANRKTNEGASHPDRDAQFIYINASPSVSSTRATCGVGRHQEERTGWGFQKWGTRMATPGATGTGAGL
jgi:transposase